VVQAHHQALVVGKMQELVAEAVSLLQVMYQLVRFLAQAVMGYTRLRLQELQKHWICYLALLIRTLLPWKVMVDTTLLGAAAAAVIVKVGQEALCLVEKVVVEKVQMT